MTILDIDADAWAANLDRAPFRIRHHLRSENRMTAESLAVLTERMPESAVEHNLGKLPALHYAAPTQRADATPAQILRTPDFLGSWMAIKNIEQDPAYRDLLLTCLDDVPATDGVPFPRHNEQGFIFVSANHSVTPSHTDPEENFLLQIQGTKEITIGSWPDEESKQREMERKLHGGHRYIPTLPVNPQKFRLEPGDGVYVPPNAPHMVEVFDEPSISLSVTFRTPAVDLFDDVVYLNGHLRRLGINPRPPGENARIDQTKALAMRIRHRVMRWRGQ